MNNPIVEESVNQCANLIFLLHHLFGDKKHVCFPVDAELAKHLDPSNQDVLLTSLGILLQLFDSTLEIRAA